MQEPEIRVEHGLIADMKSIVAAYVADQNGSLNFQHRLPLEWSLHPGYRRKPLIAPNRSIINRPTLANECSR